MENCIVCKTPFERTEMIKAETDYYCENCADELERWRA